MNDFTASNGIRVHEAAIGNGWVDVRSGYAERELHQIAPTEIAALHEFFQAEADERLGRWRWPENPEYVVYPHRRVLHEATGGSWDVDFMKGTRAPSIALAAYEAWHDARFPKPWREAKTGEVWAVTRCGGAEHPMVVEGEDFLDLLPVTGGKRRLAFRLDDKVIVQARRLWPEESK